MYKMTLYTEKWYSNMYMIYGVGYTILVCIENMYNIQMIYFEYWYVYLRK